MIAGTVSTVVFAVSNLPMLGKALRTRDVSSYSLSSIAMINAANVVYSLYVFSLPFGTDLGAAHFYLVSCAILLVLCLGQRRAAARRRRDARGGDERLPAEDASASRDVMGEMSDYIAGLEAPDRDLIERIRARAVSLVPEAVEGRSYGMPALRYRDSPLLSLMATKDHIGLYPFSPEVVSSIEGELGGYSWSKGTIRFTAEHPLPDSVVDRIILLRRDQIDAAKKR